jgi:hypothetical protein
VLDRGTRGVPRCQPVVHEDDHATIDWNLVPFSPVAANAPRQLGTLAGDHRLELVHVQPHLIDQGVVQDRDVAFGDRPDAELWLPGKPDLPDDDDVERRFETVGDRGGDGHTPSRERDDDRPEGGTR